jgi:hypothetical protein
MNSSVARIFLSSTFRDFGGKREVLANRVFTNLRKRLQEHCVKLLVDAPRSNPCWMT